ncbi:hypothetical protein VA249_45950 (plasmid) [Vibrio alfacsensis]|uniref:hypothetical protein n=1 Tax=Vibrio alfacsensis TaxID=1074311 RepID=UPI001BF12591|nr:hypothetical protein [Vibrio alfacsensis]BBM67949.1 hypothetical protein VA249_45950 [Vibrio alfacsensis]
MSISVFYRLCYDITKKGWLCLDTINSDDEKETFVCNVNNDILEFRHPLTQSYIELKFQDNRCYLNFLHAGNELGKGEGTRTLNMLLSLCDKHSITLELMTYSSIKMPQHAQRIYNFYRKFGFIFDTTHEDYTDIKAEHELTDDEFLYGIPMIRQPESKHASLLNH